MNINVYQNVYDKRLLDSVSADALPLVLSENSEELYEFQAFNELTKRKYPDESDYIGLFSVKFSQKMKITIAEAKRFVSSNKGHDVYLFNPYPYESYLFFNQWESGDFHHPGIKQVAQKLFDHFALGNVDTSPRMIATDNVFSNFWIGTREFFNEYVRFMTDAADYMIANKDLFFKNTWHMNRIGTPYFPFILERMLGVYLKSHLSRFSYISYPTSKELYGSLIPDDSPIRFEKKREHFFLVRDEIVRLDEEFRGTDLVSYRSRFSKVNWNASTLLQDGIEQLYIPKRIIR